jgi:hypothetical protein
MQMTLSISSIMKLVRRLAKLANIFNFFYIVKDVMVNVTILCYVSMRSFSMDTPRDANSLNVPSWAVLKQRNYYNTSLTVVGPEEMPNYVEMKSKCV